MNDAVVRVELTDSARTARAQRAELPAAPTASARCPRPARRRTSSWSETARRTGSARRAARRSARSAPCDRAKPSRVWRPRRRAISRRSASRKLASRIGRGRETSGSAVFLHESGRYPIPGGTASMNVHVLQHVAFEGLGSMAQWLDAAGLQTSYTRFFASPDLKVGESSANLHSLRGASRPSVSQ